jgi:hypothetical protein
MKILVLPKPIEGVSREEMLRHARQKFKPSGNATNKASSANTAFH